jgi:predicted dehydrogenase
MVAQQMRFSPLIRTARQLLAGDTIGSPGQVDISFAVPWADHPGSHYVTEPFMFLLDMGCHHFDMIRYLLGVDPESVHVMSWNLPWGWHQGDACHVAVFDFGNGLKVVHRATGCAVGEKTSWLGNWHVDGPTGSISWHDNKILVCHEHRANPPRLEEVPVDSDHQSPPQEAVLDEFLSAVTEQRKPECSGRDNLSTMAMTFAAVESAKTGRPVAISSLS